LLKFVPSLDYHNMFSAIRCDIQSYLSYCEIIFCSSSAVGFSCRYSL